MRPPSPTTFCLGCAALAAVGTVSILPGPSSFVAAAVAAGGGSSTSRPPPRHHSSRQHHPRNNDRSSRPSRPAAPPRRPAPEIMTAQGASDGEAELDVDGNTARSLQETNEGTTATTSSLDGGGHAAKLRADLLDDYDQNAYPWHAVWDEDDAAGRPRDGLPVEIGINFHRVFHVDISAATTDLIVWFRQRWSDPRLKWDPADYGNLTTSWFWIGDGMGAGEMSEIWTPDTELWNMEVGLQDSLTDAYASVTSDGLVSWSRPGHLRPACKFDGLKDFPFDTLGCTMEFGSWSYSGLYIRPVKLDEGFTLGGSETAGQTYSEYTIPSDDPDAVECYEHVYPPFFGSQDDWPVLMYHVKYSRAWQPYTRGYLTMQIILNAVGFSAFWLPVTCGERMGLSITSLLASVASELVWAESLPNAEEMTWFRGFSLFSLSFASLALFESVAVIYFYYYKGKDLKPRFWTWIDDWLAVKRDRKLMRKRGSGAGAGAEEDGAKPNSSTDTGCIGPQSTVTASNESANGSATERAEKSGEGANGSPSVDLESAQEESVTSSRKTVSFQEGGPFEKISDLPGAEPQSSPSHFRPSFLRQSVDPSDPYRNDSMISLVVGRGRDADDFQDADEAENNIRWKNISHTIDEVSRVVIPIAYLIVLAVFLAGADYS